MTKYLTVSPHPDDVEMGCFASLLKMVKPVDRVYYLSLTKCTDIPRNKHIISEIAKAMEFIAYHLNTADFSFENCDFPNRQLHESHMRIRTVMENVRDTFKPDIIFTSHPHDFHQDHNYVAHETMRVFRDRTVIFYELPRHANKFNPNMYVVLNEYEMNKTIELLSLYQSQSKQTYMEKGVIESNLRHRGSELGKPYAQAFEIMRLVLKEGM